MITDDVLHNIILFAILGLAFILSAIALVGFFADFSREGLDQRIPFSVHV